MSCGPEHDWGVIDVIDIEEMDVSVFLEIEHVFDSRFFGILKRICFSEVNWPLQRGPYFVIQIPEQRLQGQSHGVFVNSYQLPSYHVFAGALGTEQPTDGFDYGDSTFLLF